MRVRQLTRSTICATLAALVAACASEPVKEAPAPAPSAPVPVVRAAPKPVAVPAARPVAPKPVPANPLTDPHSILVRRSVFFDFDAYNVKPEYRPLVEAHAAYLKGHPGASVMIEGNSDERGSREYNLALGQRRAESVANMMILLGATARQIESVSLGEEKPKALGHDETSWAQNRRGDVVYKKER